MIQGFKEFISRGNVIDLAVAVVIGAAFGAVVSSVVDAVINPLVGALLGGTDLTQALVVEIPTVAGGTAALSSAGAGSASGLRWSTRGASSWVVMAQASRSSATRRSTCAIFCAWARWG